MDDIKWSVRLKADETIEVYVSSSENVYEAISEAILKHGTKYRTRYVPTEIEVMVLASYVSPQEYD